MDGVPVLTLAVDQFLSRQGVGLLMNAGLSDWVAADADADADDYVAKAIGQANDLKKLAALRAGLRAQVLASSLFDPKRVAKHFAKALREMCKEWCTQNDTTAP